MISECLETVRKYDKVIIFGAGVGGKTLYSLLKERGLSKRILCFSDNNAMKFGRSYCEERIRVINPNELVSLYGTTPCVLVSSSAYPPIKAQLLSLGWEPERVFLYNFAFMDLEYTDRDYIYDHIEDFERAYRRMSDEKSRKIFGCILNYRITKNVEHLERMRPEIDDERFQYFDSGLFRYDRNETILDLGAYTGDTLLAYDSLYAEWGGYIGVEADALVYERLNALIARRGWGAKAKTFRVAAWDKKETLYFSENPGSSSMSQKQEETHLGVQGERMDDLLSDTPVSFVKMDIEGAEFQAISGMENLIRRNKPILAVCVYHRRDDFFRLTDLVERILPGEYQYALRQYRYTPTETVCYMVPKSRRLHG